MAAIGDGGTTKLAANPTAPAAPGNGGEPTSASGLNPSGTQSAQPAEQPDPNRKTSAGAITAPKDPREELKAVLQKVDGLLMQFAKQLGIAAQPPADHKGRVELVAKIVNALKGEKKEQFLSALQTLGAPFALNFGQTQNGVPVKDGGVALNAGKFAGLDAQHKEFNINLGAPWAGKAAKTDTAAGGSSDVASGTPPEANGAGPADSAAGGTGQPDAISTEFKRADTTNDGKLDEKELTKYVASLNIPGLDAKALAKNFSSIASIDKKDPDSKHVSEKEFGIFLQQLNAALKKPESSQPAN